MFIERLGLFPVAGRRCQLFMNFQCTIPVITVETLRVGSGGTRALVSQGWAGE
jgi:hypothetical protein